MKLPNEYDIDWSMATSMAFAFLWRFLLFAIPLNLASGYLKSDGSNLSLIALSLVFQLGAIVVPPILAFKWMFKDGRFGSVKLVLMEVAHYQKLTSNKALHQIADATDE